MRLGFSEERDFTTEDMITVVQRFVPLAQTKSKEITQLMEWAESGKVALASSSGL